ncbi:MAG: IS110 family transposase, partial [Myxococcota bacterium]|nr:IS110 family transposase [Myxococcota bacterium]
RDWLAAQGCSHVGMESAGVYWTPVYTMLEDQFELVVGNAQQIRNVPGRKTDVKDSEWIADLLRHGLIAKSVVPPKPIRELRTLLRYRRKVVETRSAERNRPLKLLETANIKLASVVSDVFGVSGMLMLRAILEGDATPEQMAQMARAVMSLPGG